MKTCSRCRGEKPLTDFNLKTSSPDGRQPYCRPCKRVIDAAHWSVYSRSIPGVAKILSHDHGFDAATARHWAAILLDDNTRCDCCGIPRHVNIRLGFWRVGTDANRLRLSLDHIVPGSNEGGFRPLCFSCNALRGDLKLTEVEVLLIMTEWYIDRFGCAPYWLNTSIVGISGVGGTLYRNDHMARRFADLRTGDVA